MSIEYTFEIHELSRIGSLSVCHNSPRTPEPKRADRCVELDRKSRSAGGVTIIWIGRSGRIADTKPFTLLARASSRTSRVDLPFPPRRIRRLGLHHTDAPRTRYHDSLMRLGKATLLSNQLAVHPLEFVRPRLGALRNLACHPPRRRQAVERRSNAREPGPPSFGSKDRSARSAWCSSGRAAPAHPPGRQRWRLYRRSGSSPRSGVSRAAQSRRSMQDAASKGAHGAGPQSTVLEFIVAGGFSRRPLPPPQENPSPCAGAADTAVLGRFRHHRHPRTSTDRKRCLPGRQIGRVCHPPAGLALVAMFVQLGGCRVGRTRSVLGRAKRASRRGRSPQEAV
jgi:hypothetical protein